MILARDESEWLVDVRNIVNEIVLILGNYVFHLELITFKHFFLLLVFSLFCSFETNDLIVRKPISIKSKLFVYNNGLFNVVV